MKEIPVRGGFVALVDDEDYELASQYCWRPLRQTNRRTIYARAYVRGTKPQRQVCLHRLIMDSPAGVQVDHVDCNGLNCQRHNLRLATRAQNRQNTPKCRSYKGHLPSSRFKGVRWYLRNKTWMACGEIDGNKVYLGSFDDEAEAAKSYNAFALEHYGEFARLNDVTA
jgi:hypothetical protein